MDIRRSLEIEHSRSMTTAIVRYVGNDKRRFKTLMDVFFNSEYRITQRAAWPLSDIAIEYPELVRPYLEKFIRLLKKPGLHSSIPRNILRLLQDYNIPERHAAEVFDLCLNFLRDENAAVAVRAFAITTAGNIASRYEGLDQELRPVLEELLDYPQTPAIRQRIKKALKA